MKRLRSSGSNNRFEKRRTKTRKIERKKSKK